MRCVAGVISLTALLMVAGLCVPVAAQQPSAAGPVVEAQLISLAGQTQFDQALRIIGTYANRVIVDSQRRTLPIGVEIAAVPWEHALAQIAQQHALQVEDQVHYLELVPLAEGDRVSATGTGASLDSPEVNIKAIFFQADRSILRQMGIDWSTLKSGRVDVTAGQFGARNVISDQFVVGVGGNTRSLSIDALFKSFESRNAGEVVARPEVKVRSGMEGFIQVGSDFSITTSDFSGNAITEFVSTGTILSVKPIVRIEDGIDFIELWVEAERSSLVDPVRNLISKTVARTSVLMRDGEQTAIAGLYGEDMSVDRGGVPFLKDLPPWLFGLRYLFGHESRLISETELILMLKVNIVPSVRERIESLSREQEVTPDG